MDLKNIIIVSLKQIMNDSEIPFPDNLSEETVLLDTGLDSLGFAILVGSLEEKLGWDPFIRMEDAVYPKTLGEFIAIYETSATLSND